MDDARASTRCAADLGTLRAATSMNQVGQTATDSYPEAVVTRCLDPLGQLWTWSRPPLNPRVRPCPLHARSRGKPRVPTVTRGQEPASIAWADAGHSPWSLSLPRRGSVLLDNLGRIRRVKAKPAYAGTSQVDLEIPHSESPEARPEVRTRPRGLRLAGTRVIVLSSCGQRRAVPQGRRDHDRDQGSARRAPPARLITEWPA